MDKDQERVVEFFSKALVSLPFDVKVLLEAVADPDLENSERELAAAAIVHILTPKDGNVEPFLRHAEDVVLVRLALKRIADEGGEDAETFKTRFDDHYEKLDEELRILEGMFGTEVMQWLDTKWPALRKGVFAKKKISQFVEDEEVGNFLYEEGLRFATDYPITEKSLAGRVKHSQPIVDHLLRKHEQDSKKITQT